MAKICPFNATTMQRLCNIECALSINGECAITHIAESFRHREIQKEVWSKLCNMKYGTLSDNYIDTDSVRKEISNENSDRNV